MKFTGFEAMIVLVLLICYIVAWVFTMQIVTKAAREKGYVELGPKLWFIGLFGLIFTPGIIVAALPDKKLQDAQAKAEKPVQDELPAI